MTAGLKELGLGGELRQSGWEMCGEPVETSPNESEQIKSETWNRAAELNKH